ncbi:MAG: hypothetical protein N2038_13920 [Geminicoccaceae bacterium]|nr:hypothetical protein [Geminicoccaceae bacterium]MCX7631330.1 hypothetical protein [Geminicoccaceae bacterium]MDW8123917.1 hypothetical protein [Geminicoccaceae bacterium]MDW8340020.1 hypothetical protein [Geminicoccaceae bacterium]
MPAQGASDHRAEPIGAGGGLESGTPQEDLQDFREIAEHHGKARPARTAHRRGEFVGGEELVPAASGARAAIFDRRLLGDEGRLAGEELGQSLEVAAATVVGTERARASPNVLHSFEKCGSVSQHGGDLASWLRSCAHLTTD